MTPERLRAYDTRLAEELGGLDPARRGYAWVRDVRQAGAARRDLAELAAAYRQEKTGRDLLDFGDQIALSASLAQDRPEVGAILRDQYRVVLLDEYQDTSVAQRLLLAGLFGGGTGHPVTAVGDPCQAIYGWRGASVANLDDFPRHFPYADGRLADRYALSENRRSGGRLLDLANTLAAELRARHKGVEALRPAPGAERDGLVRCALLPTQADETTWLADSLAHLVRTGTPPGEIAVLCRTAGQFADIHAALVARDVPVEVVGLSGLLHLPEVADLVATCEVLHDPTANAALVRLLTGPRWRIGPRDLALLGRRARLLVRYGPAPGEGADRLAAAVEGVDPAEIVSLADALETFLDADPRRRTALLRRGAGALRPARRRDKGAAALARRPADGRAAPGAGRDRPGGRTRRVPARPRRPPPRDPARLPRRRRRVRRPGRRGDAAGVPRLPAHRRAVREGARQLAARWREHRQGAHRPQVQGARMGRGGRARPRRQGLPQRTRPRAVAHRRQGAAARAARRRRHPARRARMDPGGPRRLPRRDEGAPAHRGTAARLRHVHPAAVPAARLRPLVGPQPGQAVRALRLPRRPARALRGGPRRDRDLGRAACRGRHQPGARRRHRTAVAAAAGPDRARPPPPGGEDGARAARRGRSRVRLRV